MTSDTNMLRIYIQLYNIYISLITIDIHTRYKMKYICLTADQEAPEELHMKLYKTRQDPICAGDPVLNNRLRRMMFNMHLFRIGWGVFCNYT